MSHFKDFMWVDGWSTTRERTVVKIPINEGQRNMTWSASGPYLPMTRPVDWNCIPSALGCGSALSVSAGRLHFPLTGSWVMPLSHPVLTSHLRQKMNSSFWGILCCIIMQNCAASHLSGQFSFFIQLWEETEPNLRGQTLQLRTFLCTGLENFGCFSSIICSLTPFKIHPRIPPDTSVCEQSQTETLSGRF